MIIPKDCEVKTTASGLKYSVLRAGREGPHPSTTDRVKVHYTGWLPNGTVFDTSVPRGIPVEFCTAQVIAGWAEGLQLMTPEAKFKFTIPYSLAYGEKGMPPKIPPKTDLIFEVELFEVLEGPVLPGFHPRRDEAVQKTEKGLIYEVLTEGDGSTADEGDWIQVAFAYWTTDGALVNCSEMQGRDAKYPLGRSKLGILNEAPRIMREGARYRFEVPADLAFAKPEQDTVWEVELVRVHKPIPLPDFNPPQADKARKTKRGLLHESLKLGTGKSPQEKEEVLVHFAGWLDDGTLFDSSYSRGEAVSMRLDNLVPGLKEGLKLMREGGISTFSIPPKLAYGDKGAPPLIPPESALIFHVELIETRKG